MPSSFEYLSQHQVDKDSVINDNFDNVANFTFIVIKSYEAIPPAIPVEGDVYIIPPDLNWLNSGYSYPYLAQYKNGSWSYLYPPAGLIVCCSLSGKKNLLLFAGDASASWRVVGLYAAASAVFMS